MIDDMTFEQIIDAWNEGKPPRMAVAGPEQVIALRREFREWIRGLG